jgi:hypothetical protein
MTKLIAVAVSVGLAVVGGWLWGNSGRSAEVGSLQTSELRSELLGARAATLDARVAIYNVNFGEASQHLEDAKGLLSRADGRLKTLGRDDSAKQVQTAVARLVEAQRLNGKLDQTANSVAGEAAKILADVLAVEAKR